MREVGYSIDTRMMSLTRSQTYSDRITSLKPSARPTSVSICKFTRLERPATRMWGTEGDIYIFVAITGLSDSTGMTQAETSTARGLQSGTRVVLMLEADRRVHDPPT